MQVINKKIVIFIFLSIFIFSMFKLFNEQEIELDEVKLDIKNNNSFAIYIEDGEDGYKEQTDSSVFPFDNYVFNKELSGCVDIYGNDVKDVLSYEKDIGISVNTNKTLYCYLYFDKGRTYILMGQNGIIKNLDFELINMLGTESNFETKDDFSYFFNRPSSANPGRTVCNVDSTLYKYGNNSCKISNLQNTGEQYIATKKAHKIDNSHMYYARVEYYAKAIGEPSIEFFWPYYAGPPLGQSSVSIQKFEQWDVAGVIGDRTTFDNVEVPLRIDFNYYDMNYESNSMDIRFDGAMLIDLTESYGSNYPSVEQLNKLMYFDNSVEIKEIFSKNGIFELNSNISKIECNNNATTEIENLKVTIISDEDYTVCMIKE